MNENVFYKLSIDFRPLTSFIQLVLNSRDRGELSGSGTVSEHKNNLLYFRSEVNAAEMFKIPRKWFRMNESG